MQEVNHDEGENDTNEDTQQELLSKQAISANHNPHSRLEQVSNKHLKMRKSAINTEKAQSRKSSDKRREFDYQKGGEEEHFEMRRINASKRKAVRIKSKPVQEEAKVIKETKDVKTFESIDMVNAPQIKFKI